MRTKNGSEGDERPLLLTLDEAAYEFRVCSKTIRNWADRGDIPLLKLGRSTRIRWSDLEAYLDRVARGAIDGGKA
jgi:excisionase family DNA binding protein